jgi:hypothetical protein
VLHHCCEDRRALERVPDIGERHHYLVCTSHVSSKSTWSNLRVRQFTHCIVPAPGCRSFEQAGLVTVHMQHSRSTDSTRPSPKWLLLLGVTVGCWPIVNHVHVTVLRNYSYPNPPSAHGCTKMGRCKLRLLAHFGPRQSAVSSYSER